MKWPGSSSVCLAPKCPCDKLAKHWVNDRLTWLTEQFDDHVFNGRPMVLPIAAHFPAPYDRSEEAVRVMLDQICEYMDVDSEQVDLEFVSDVGKLWLIDGRGQYIPNQPAGTYREEDGRYVIQVDTSELETPQLACDWLREQGVPAAMVETGADPGHAPARRTYERNGFSQWPAARYFKLLH